jgi:coniferyl-aldehyde dehydrogenase
MTITDVTTQPTDAERFKHILQAQRAAYPRDVGIDYLQRNLRRFMRPTT